MQADAIPEELFLHGAQHLGTTLEVACRDPLEWERIVAIACSYSLLSRQQADHTFSLHRLVQAVIGDVMTETEQEQWTRHVIGALEQMFPEEVSATWKQGERLLPHALLCLHRAGTAERCPVFASLAFKTAQYLQELGRYTEADLLYQRALSLREQALGPAHPDVARVLNRLGILYWKQGKYAEAEALYRQALSIWQQALGPAHPHVAQVLNNLAELYVEQGKYEEAEPLYQRALSIWEKVLGPDNPHMALPLDNLAKLYVEQGKYEEAEPLLRRAMHLKMHTWSPDHPEVADLLNDLANLLFKQRKDEQAEALYQRALHIREQHLGQHHPETAQTLHDLALLQQKQGNLDKAISFAERALLIRSHSLGDAHPKTIATQTLYTQLVREHEETEKGTPSQPCAVETSDSPKEKRTSERVSRSLQETPCEKDHFQAFLGACCELHPRAWCRSADLWQAYEQWSRERQERYTLSRGVFIAQLKAHDCRADRTMTARIWRGIALVKKDA